MKHTLLFLFTIISIGLYAQNIIKPTSLTQTQGTSLEGGAGLGIYRINLINGSGLNSEPTTVADLATTTHAVSWAASWATADEGTPAGNPYFPSRPAVIFELDLDVVYNVSLFAYWGYPLATDNNPKGITFDFSTDGGLTYSSTENVILGSSVDDGSVFVHQQASFSTPRSANYIRMTITSNQGGTRIGFGELRFGGTLHQDVPVTPSNLVATGTSTSEITVTWTDNSTNETGFIVERKAEGVSDYVQIATTSANATSYSDSGLDPSTIYSYRIVASNASAGAGFDSPPSEGSGATLAANGNTTTLITPSSISQTAADSEACCGLSVGAMVDNSGLSPSPTVSNLYGVLHSGDFVAGNAWATATELAGGYTLGGGTTPVFTLSLGDTYNMSGLAIWGYPLFSLHEAKDIKLEFSTDGGATYLASETVTSPTALGGDSKVSILPFSAIRTADFVRMSFTSDYSGGRVAMGEVKFIGSSSTPLSINSEVLAQVQIHPNPTSDFINVSNLRGENLYIEIHDILGKKIKNVELSNSSDKVDVRDLTSGLYFLSINNSKIMKFLKK